MIEGWSPQGFVALRENGNVTVAGWVKGAFALDFRPLHWSLWDSISEEAAPFVWVLTHVPTGYGVMAVADAFPDAARIADELAELTDWSIVTVESSRWFERRVREIFARYPHHIYNAEQTITPWVEREGDA